MTTEADASSLKESIVTETRTHINVIANGITNARIIASRPMLSEAHTFTCSPMLYAGLSDVYTSIIFSLLSEEEQMFLTWHEEHADDCTILTFMCLPSICSIIPL